MTSLGSDARRHLGELTAYYTDKQRPEAIRNLVAAIRRASARISRTPSAGLPAPRPYPTLTMEGCRWIKESPYWIVYTDAPDPVILGIYHESADIPRRL